MAAEEDTVKHHLKEGADWIISGNVYLILEL